MWVRTQWGDLVNLALAQAIYIVELRQAVHIVAKFSENMVPLGEFGTTEEARRFLTRIEEEFTGRKGA